MRLDDARLCLDCEEIHGQQECPACGSEAFAFLTRWIQSTSSDRPKPRAAKAERANPRVAPMSEHIAAWRQLADGTPGEPSGRAGKLVTRSLLGLAAMGLAGWAWSKTALNKDEEG